MIVVPSDQKQVIGAGHASVEYFSVVVLVFCITITKKGDVVYTVCVHIRVWVGCNF